MTFKAPKPEKLRFRGTMAGTTTATADEDKPLPQKERVHRERSTGAWTTKTHLQWPPC